MLHKVHCGGIFLLKENSDNYYNILRIRKKVQQVDQKNNTTIN